MKIIVSEIFQPRFFVSSFSAPRSRSLGISSFETRDVRSAGRFCHDRRRKSHDFAVEGAVSYRERQLMELIGYRMFCAAHGVQPRGMWKLVMSMHVCC